MPTCAGAAQTVLGGVGATGRGGVTGTGGVTGRGGATGPGGVTGRGGVTGTGIVTGTLPPDPTMVMSAQLLNSCRCTSAVVVPPGEWVEPGKAAGPRPKLAWQQQRKRAGHAYHGATGGPARDCCRDIMRRL